MINAERKKYKRRLTEKKTTRHKSKSFIDNLLTTFCVNVKCLCFPCATLVVV